jgi:hypothetical protein
VAEEEGPSVVPPIREIVDKKISLQQPLTLMVEGEASRGF